MEITQEYLREILDYNPLTGEFVWRVNFTMKARKGAPAGYYGMYVFIRLHGRLYRAHRLAWLYVYGSWPVGDVDHKDRNKHNNAIANLRDVTPSENLMNAKTRVDSSSGHRGVSRFPNNRWRAYITVNGKQHHLGSFASYEEATQARIAAEKHHGVFVHR